MEPGQFFAKDWSGPAFEMFSPPHLAALFAIILLNIGLLRFKSTTEETRRRLRWTLAIILWANELSWHLWNYAVGQWDIQTMLPLHLCSVLVWASALALVTRNYGIYEFMYFMGIAGALQALLTPDLGIYGFPHYRFWQTYISHGLIVTAAIYMTVVEGFRPTWKSLGRVFFLDECLYGHRLCHQYAYRLKLPVHCPQAADRQPAGRTATLALLHSVYRGDWAGDVPDFVHPIHHQGLAGKAASAAIK